MEKFSSPEFPLVINKIAILAFFERTPEEVSKFEIEWKLSNNDIIIKNDKVMVDFNGRLKHKWINIFQWIEIKDPWELRLSIYQWWKEINRYIIEVEKIFK